MTNIEYIEEYTKIVYSHDLDRLAEELDGHVLLCYCSKDVVCHRYLLGKYLYIETSIEVEEIGGFSDIFAESFAKKEHPMELILTTEDKDKYNLHDKFEDDNIMGHWRELKALGAVSLFTDWAKT